MGTMIVFVSRMQVHSCQGAVIDSRPEKITVEILLLCSICYLDNMSDYDVCYLMI